MPKRDKAAMPEQEAITGTPENKDAEQSQVEQEPPAPAPEKPENGDIGGNSQTPEQSQAETPGPPVPAPEVPEAQATPEPPAPLTPGTPENKDAEKQGAEQSQAEQEPPIPAPEQPETKKAGKPPKEEKAEQAAPAPEKPEKPKRRGRPPKADKEPETEQAAPQAEKAAPQPAQEEAPAPTEPEPPAPPRDATRPGETETIVYINHADLHPFKGHPFKVRDDEAMQSLVESVKDRGVDQPALVRPREGGGYEIVAGHRRQHASELAGYTNVPCVVRNLSDDEAVLAMTESNFNQRAEILPSERAQALKMQYEAIKHQGARFEGVAAGDVGKRSIDIVGERNKMTAKQVQRYIALNKLVPELMKHVDDKQLKFTVAVDLAHIKPKNQRYIAVAMEAQEAPPTGLQAQRMRELDQQGLLNNDNIDGIMLEEKRRRYA